MRELLTDIFHWRAEHPDIHVVVDSYYVASLEPACLIDPLEPVEGLAWFDGREPPRHVYLTNRLHERHCRTFVDAFGCAVWCHRSGLHEFADSELEVRPYEHGDELPGGIRALEVAIICPEETALHIPLAGGLLSIGDAIQPGLRPRLPDRRRSASHQARYPRRSSAPVRRTGLRPPAAGPW